MAQPLYAQAMKSKYTKLLLENFLLSPYEMTDPTIMADLQQNQIYFVHDLDVTSKVCKIKIYDGPFTEENFMMVPTNYKIFKK